VLVDHRTVSVTRVPVGVALWRQFLVGMCWLISELCKPYSPSQKNNFGNNFFLLCRATSLDVLDEPYDFSHVTVFPIKQKVSSGHF
jgi:hypothetical protein